MAQFKDTKNIIWPKYNRDEKLKIDKEIDEPPHDLFIGLGFDDDKDTKRRHYRRFYPDELENCREIMGDKHSPFNSFNLQRGQTRGAHVGFW